MDGKVPTASSVEDEITTGDRFAFGENWRSYLDTIDEVRIDSAKAALKKVLENTGIVLAGKTFLDAGCGSGLMSLAAHGLGMRVVSFDYDPASVYCARLLKEKYAPDDQSWRILQGSLLDENFMEGLGTFDLVCSWGVCHHTGDMYMALTQVSRRVAEGGGIVVSIYNDQGFWSKQWKRVKATYNRLPKPLKLPFALLVMVPRELKIVGVPVLKGKFHMVWERWTQPGARGMNFWHDLIDWVGGYPFEVAKPEEIFTFFKHRGFTLVGLATCGGELGCNEYVFTKTAS